MNGVHIEMRLFKDIPWTEEQITEYYDAQAEAYGCTVEEFKERYTNMLRNPTHPDHSKTVGEDGTQVMFLLWAYPPSDIVPWDEVNV